MSTPLPAMRLKTRWFKPGGQDAAVQASAVAFVSFRVARRTLDRLRLAQFTIDAGPAYFDVLRETLVFLALVADRIAHARLYPEDRVAFTTALVRHLARLLQENEDDLLGPAPAGRPPHGERFVELFNELAEHYAEFEADPATRPEDGFSPGFGFVRYFGSRLEPALPEADRRWVLDQVMATEAPDAVAQVQRAMRELFDPTPRRARREHGVSGE